MPPDVEMIRRALGAILAPGQVFEVRNLDVAQRYGAPAIVAGYFDADHIDDAALAVAGISGAKGSYYTPNPCNPDLLARCAYRVERKGKNDPLTGNHEIERRRWFLIDCDPDRPAGICATDAERDAAHALGSMIRDTLTAEGWPAPIYCDSGNGAQFLYRVDLPADDGGLCERATKALAARFNTADVHVDESVHNAARIWRLPGTWNRKGDDIPARPHRMARLVDVPEVLDVVPVERLEALTAGTKAADPTPTTTTTKHRARKPVDPSAEPSGDAAKSKAWLTKWLETHKPESVEVRGPEPWQGKGFRWILNPCPWNPEHTNDSAFVLVWPDGTIGAGCQHNSCTSNDWRALRELWEPEAANRKPMVFLPQGGQPISETGKTLGELLDETKRFFIRGGAVVKVKADVDGLPVLDEAKPATLASDFEAVARLMRWAPQRGKTEDGTPKPPKPEAAICCEQTAKIISAAATFRDALPPINVLTRCPVLIERSGTLLQVSGYDRAAGIYAAGKPAEAMTLPEAAALLNEMIEGFRFATPADRARALAAIITPALVFGGLLRGRAPVDLGEADNSQSGKGYRNKLTAALYAQSVKGVTQKSDNGVGSLEESFNMALIRGANFVALDNVRGRIDSPAIESFLTEDNYTARAPYREPVEIDPRRVVVMFTSNKADVTTDLANRSSCVRILKQPEGYHFKTYPEGDILEHVRAMQPRYLGAVFAVISAWHEAGKPRTTETRHDFRAWAQTLDWITRNLLDAGPLLDGHKETQIRMTNPALNWLRDVALDVLRANRGDQWLRTGDLVDVIDEAGQIPPGLKDGADLTDNEVRKAAQQATGRKLSLCFRTVEETTEDGTTIERIRMDGMTIDRLETYDKESRFTVRQYRFKSAANENASIAASIAANPETPAENVVEQSDLPFAANAAANGAANKPQYAANAANDPPVGETLRTTSQNIATMGTISRISRNTPPKPSQPWAQRPEFVAARQAFNGPAEEGEI